MVYSLQNHDRPEQAPTTWEAFWAEAAEMLEMARCDLEKDLQSRTEAIADDRPGDRYGTIRFRKSDDPDQLAHFYELGRTTLEIVDDMVGLREWTPALAHHWSILMFCHGFVMPSAFATGSDLTDDRRGLRGGEATSREAQRRWYAHYLLREFRKPRKRADAEARILRLIDGLISGSVPMPAGFGADWFRKLKDDAELGLSSTLEQITRPKAMQIIKEGVGEIPPTDLPIP